jgi:predicted Rossmann fold nucleotide-binding protein DprA/Smf involved in DNA uptake
MDLLTDLGWSSKKCNAETPQKRLFPDLTVEEQAIVDALVTAEETGETPTLTYLADVTGQLAFKVTSTILALEMKGLVKILPGNRYHLINA